jgi:dTDP-4-dehydrorhamnose 3,5-epimerase
MYFQCRTVSNEDYSYTDRCGVRYNDPAVNIIWPMTATDISQRDTSHPLLSIDFAGIPV